MKKLMLILIFIIPALLLFSQSNRQISLRSSDIFIYNPAIAGASLNHRINSNSRVQPLQIEGSPKLSTLSYNGYLGHNMGLGSFIAYEKYGLENNILGNLSYAYHIIGDKNIFSLGLSATIQNYNLSFTDEDVHPEYRNILTSGTYNNYYLDFNTGMFLSNQKNYYIGLSANIFSQAISQTIYEEQQLLKEVILLAGYSIINKEKFRLTPTFIAISDFSLYNQIETGILTELHIFNFGVKYRTFYNENKNQNQYIICNVGIRLKNLLLTYAYDWNINNNMNAHEISISYFLFKKSKPLFNKIPSYQKL